MDKTLFWVGALAVGYWAFTRENGFMTTVGSLTTDLGFGGNPSDQNLSQQESANWWAKWLQATPATTQSTSVIRKPTDTGAQIRARIDSGVFGL